MLMFRGLGRIYLELGRIYMELGGYIWRCADMFGGGEDIFGVRQLQTGEAAHNAPHIVSHVRASNREEHSCKIVELTGGKERYTQSLMNGQLGLPVWTNL